MLEAQSNDHMSPVIELRDIIAGKEKYINVLINSSWNPWSNTDRLADLPLWLIDHGVSVGAADIVRPTAAFQVLAHTEITFIVAYRMHASRRLKGYPRRCSRKRVWRNGTSDWNGSCGAITG